MISGNSQCNYYKTCTDCRDDPECGWCDDGSGTGLGSCMAGGNTPPQLCSQNKWYFTHCPSKYTKSTIWTKTNFNKCEFKKKSMYFVLETIRFLN